jgi:hypothetical protein
MASDREAGILITENALYSAHCFQEVCMLDHLRQKAARTLASVHSVILSSYGPADIQSSRVSSAAQDLTLYVFIPPSSDHLLNLEHRPGIVAATEAWELRGTARVLSPNEIPAGVRAAEDSANSNSSAPGAYIDWGCVVEIRPTRLTIHSPTGQGNLETIDF